MKKTIFKLSFAILFAIVSLFAAKTAYSQVPDAINFQAIARNANGDVLANTEIMLRLSILDGSAEGTQVYSEVRTLTTNNYGSFSFQIGRGATEVDGDFSAIDWSANDKFIKIDYDPTASSNFELSLGTIEFVTVPYAFTARDVIYIDANGATDGDMLIFNATTGKFEPGQVSAGVVEWNDIQGKPDFAEVATSGDYSHLINTPELATVATTGDYDDLEGKPEFATVATSGNYNHLTNTPELATVATSGDYGDLINPPVLFSGNYNDLQGAPELNIDNWNTAHSWGNHAELYRPVTWVPLWDDINEKPEFKEVATSGDYNHLINTPELATVATTGDYVNLINTPTNLSEFNNDEGYLKTESQNLSAVLTEGNSAGGENITDLANPTEDQHAATKFYVDDKVNTLGEEVDALENTVSGLSDNVSNLTTTVDGLTTNVGNLTTNLGNLANDVDALETDLDDLSDNLDANVNALLARIDTLEFFFTDTRDSNVYRTVQIGNQIWMAENLKYLPSVVGSSTGSDTEAYYYVYGYESTDVDAAKATENYTTYGVLYNWTSALNACPVGWHLPSDAECTQLTDYLGENAGDKLKEAGITHWPDPNTGATNEVGFTALPGGAYNYGYFTGIGNYGFWWSATENDTDKAWLRSLGDGDSDVYRDYRYKSSGYSVRCVKNAYDDWSSLNNTPTTLEGYGITDATLANVLAQGNSANSQNIKDLATPVDAQDAATKAYVDALEATVTTLLAMVQELEISNGFFTDTRDNNRYNVVKIGEQIWMAENLAYKPSSGNYWAYNNDDSYIATYGYLYDWNATMNGAESSNSTPSGVQGICPVGWHLPSDAEWTILTDYLGGEDVAGGKLKEAGTDHWADPNTGAGNESGFTALPGGRRDYYGYFLGIGYYGVWWSSTENATDDAWGRYLYYGSSDVNRYDYFREAGFSVRCVRD